MVLAEIAPRTISILCFAGAVLIPLAVLASRPGAIARKRGHPDAREIGLCGWFGIVFPPLLVAAFIWAYRRPARTPMNPQSLCEGGLVRVLNVVGLLLVCLAVIEFVAAVLLTAMGYASDLSQNGAVALEPTKWFAGILFLALAEIVYQLRLMNIKAT